MDLYVGKLDEDLEADVADAAPATKSIWQSAPPDIAWISILNLASVGAFLAHAAGLEGLTDLAEGRAHPRLSHLPWWEFCIWLPFELEPGLHDQLADVYLGSSMGLLRGLEALRTRSPLHLGDAPRGYSAMRADPAQFARSEFATDNEVATIQWVWLGLYEAAGLSIEHGAPLRSF